VPARTSVSHLPRLACCGFEGELGRFEPTEDLDPPGADQTRFLALTYDGPRAAGGRSETLGAGSDPLSAIFLAGHELVGELRLLSER
jgi:hypothetical protein